MSIKQTNSFEFLGFQIKEKVEKKRGTKPESKQTKITKKTSAVGQRNHQPTIKFR